MILVAKTNSNKNTYSIILLALIIMQGLFSGCSKDQKLKLHSLTGQTMGTSYSVKVILANNAIIKIPALALSFKKILQDINQSMSTYIKDSELSKLNLAPQQKEIVLSKDLYYVINEAIKISQLSLGAYDITLGPLVNLWGFGPQKKLDTILPLKSDITQALARTGYKNLKLNNQRSSLVKMLPNMYLDLSSIAKGFAVDKLADFLKASKISNFLVEIGGEIRTEGDKYGAGWGIGILTPDQSVNQPIKRVYSKHFMALATSGDYLNFYKVGGDKYSHTISPKSGTPVKFPLTSVTVISKKSCLHSDAWATALFSLGPELGYALALKLKIAAYFIIKTKDAADRPIFKQLATPSFNKLVGK